MAAVIRIRAHRAGPKDLVAARGLVQKRGFWRRMEELEDT